MQENSSDTINTLIWRTVLQIQIPPDTDSMGYAIQGRWAKRTRHSGCVCLWGNGADIAADTIVIAMGFASLLSNGIITQMLFADVLSWAVTNRSDIAVWTEIVASVAVIIATGFGVYQYRKVRKAQRQEKSAQIMRAYSNATIHHISIIDGFFEEHSKDIGPIINKINRYRPLSFTSRELTKFGVMEHEKERYFDFINTAKLEAMSGTSRSGKKYKYLDYLPSSLKPLISNEYTLHMYIETTLNELEWMCMEIESGAADDGYIYGSLHQTLLPFVHKTAIVIQNMNDGTTMPDENYYPYVARLYRRWVRREQGNHDIVDRYYRFVQWRISRRKI